VHWAVVYPEEEVVEETQEQVSDREEGTVEMQQTRGSSLQAPAAVLPLLLPTNREEATRLNKVRQAVGTDLTSKYCTLCMTDKKLADYSMRKDGLFGRHSYCRTCTKKCTYSRDRQRKAKVKKVEYKDAEAEKECEEEVEEMEEEASIEREKEVQGKELMTAEAKVGPEDRMQERVGDEEEETVEMQRNPDDHLQPHAAALPHLPPDKQRGSHTTQPGAMRHWE
jgi:hypothetical protein